MQRNWPTDVVPYDVERIRAEEYPQLRNKTYLDHTGTTLYAKSLMTEFAADMIANLYGNPHSESVPSMLAGRRIECIRERTLRFFNASPDEFDLIFVSNASAAIKLVYEALRDYAEDHSVWFGYHKDSHNSVIGMREAFQNHHCFANDGEVECWIDSRGCPSGPSANEIGLFAYPAQSNMTGRRLPLDWSGRIRHNLSGNSTFTLLDAAAFASTALLDLSEPEIAADFIPLSFYKIFGFPNLGALIVRKTTDALSVLRRRKYFGGGTIDIVVAVDDTWHVKAGDSLHRCLEDGTVPFASIFALDHAITVHWKLYGPNPMANISLHTTSLMRQMHAKLVALRHANSTPVVLIYNDASTIFENAQQQGSALAFNIQRPDGTLVPWSEVQYEANRRDIYVRAGSLCNPGGVATYLSWSAADLRRAYANGHSCSHPVPILWGKATGVVRASIGAMSNAEDVDRLVNFLQEVYSTSGIHEHKVGSEFETGIPRIVDNTSPSDYQSTLIRDTSLSHLNHKPMLQAQSLGAVSTTNAEEKPPDKLLRTCPCAMTGPQALALGATGEDGVLSDQKSLSKSGGDQNPNSDCVPYKRKVRRLCMFANLLRLKTRKGGLAHK